MLKANRDRRAQPTDISNIICAANIAYGLHSLLQQITKQLGRRPNKALFAASKLQHNIIAAAIIGRRPIAKQLYAASLLHKQIALFKWPQATNKAFVQSNIAGP